MRHVFPTSEIAHLWAHQTQSDARNSTGNMFFDGPTIYSYGCHFPMARIYPNPTGKRLDGAPLVLTNSMRYSHTTARHQSLVERACSHLRTIAVPMVECSYYTGRALKDREHKANLEYFAREIAEHLSKAQRALQISKVDWRLARAQGLHQDALDYSAFFGIRRKVPAFPAAAWDAARERVQRIETPDPIRDAAKIRARERKAERERVKLGEVYRDYCTRAEAYNAAVRAERAKLPPFDAVEHWRLTGKWEGQRVELPEGAPSAPHFDYSERALRRKLENLFAMPMLEQCYDSRRPDQVFLRVAEDQIVTSRGARIPLEHAPRIWRLVQACRSAGRAYERNGHTEHAGTYAIDRVTAEGELTAGCHTIPYAELERMARHLNFIGRESGKDVTNG